MGDLENEKKAERGPQGQGLGETTDSVDKPDEESCTNLVIQYGALKLQMGGLLGGLVVQIDKLLG